jgi:hypothetical protein
MELLNKGKALLSKFISSFKKTKLFTTVEDMYQDMIDKKNDYYNHKVDKYVIEYNITDDEHIEVKSNIGRTRIVKNTKDNVNKLNRVIVRSKVEIARKIDEYEKESNLRLFILLTSIIMLCISFACVLGSLFMGNYIILIASIFVFASIWTLSLIQGSNLYILIQEIRSLKHLTGYKEDMEIEIPKLKEVVKKGKLRKV